MATSRMRIIRRFLDADWQVIVAASQDAHSASLADAGVVKKTVPFCRGGLHPVCDLHAFIQLRNIMREYAPILVHNFQMKPTLFGTAAARLTTKSIIVNTITGLGQAFTSGYLNGQLASLAYRLSSSRSDVTIFQNSDDRQRFLQGGWLRPHQARLVVGSGVNLSKYYPRPSFHDGQLRVLMVARLLWNKGVGEYLTAVEMIREAFPEVRFQLGGEWELTNVGGIEREYIDAWIEKGIIEFVGYVEAMPKMLRQSDIFVLPSYYGEGVPRVLLEASASGLPVITTDSPGCREAVVHGKTGLLVPPRDAVALATALSTLLSQDEYRHRLGQAARTFASEHFDIERITDRYIDIYRELGIEI